MLRQIKNNESINNDFRELITEIEDYKRNLQPNFTKNTDYLMTNLVLKSEFSEINNPETDYSITDYGKEIHTISRNKTEAKLQKFHGLNTNSEILNSQDNIIAAESQCYDENNEYSSIINKTKVLAAQKSISSTSINYCASSVNIKPLRLSKNFYKFSQKLRYG